MPRSTRSDAPWGLGRAFHHQCESHAAVAFGRCCEQLSSSIPSYVSSCQEVHKSVLPSFSNDVCKEAVVIEGDEVMTLRPEEEGTPKRFVNTWKIPKGEVATTPDGGGLGSVVPGTQRRGVERCRGS